MKFGLFGGTFNPIHNGHIKVICHVKERFGLDEVYLIPSAVPPHKSDIDLAAAKDRLDMVQCSINNIPGLIASDAEIRRKGPSFTIDTIKQFEEKKLIISEDHQEHHALGGNYAAVECHSTGMTAASASLKRKSSHNSVAVKSVFYLIMGADAFFDIPTWKKNIEIFNRVQVIVMTRAGERKNLRDIARLIRDMISDKYRFDEKSWAFLNPDMKTIYIHQAPAIKLSSTSIRKNVKLHCSISDMVHPCVEKIIRKKRLYL